MATVKLIGGPGCRTTRRSLGHVKEGDLFVVQGSGIGQDLRQRHGGAGKAIASVVGNSWPSQNPPRELARISSVPNILKLCSCRQ